MRAAPLTLSLLLVAGSGNAWAQSSPPTRIAPPPPPSAIGAPAGPTLTGQPDLTPEGCRSLAERQHGAPPAAYQPGLDVYGRPVAPADLPGNNVAVPSVTTEINIGRVPAGHASAGGLIRGYITVEPDGKVLLNGQPLPEAQEYGLYDLCREQRMIP